MLTVTAWLTCLTGPLGLVALVVGIFLLDPPRPYESIRPKRILRKPV
jgi:hypothetical protein